MSRITPRSPNALGGLLASYRSDCSSNTFCEAGVVVSQRSLGVVEIGEGGRRAETVLASEVAMNQLDSLSQAERRARWVPGGTPKNLLGDLSEPHGVRACSEV